MQYRSISRHGIHSESTDYLQGHDVPIRFHLFAPEQLWFFRRGCDGKCDPIIVARAIFIQSASSFNQPASLHVLLS